MKRRLRFYEGVGLVIAAAVFALYISRSDEIASFPQEQAWLQSKPCIFAIDGAVPLGGHFFKFEQHIYWGCAVISDADTSSFKPYLPEYGTKNGMGPESSAFSRDKKHVYFSSIIGTTIVDSADPATFTVLGTTWGGVSIYERDAEHVYWYNQVVLSTDVNSFRVISSAQSVRYDAEDKYQKYLFGKPAQ